MTARQLDDPEIAAAETVLAVVARILRAEAGEPVDHDTELRALVDVERSDRDRRGRLYLTDGRVVAPEHVVAAALAIAYDACVELAALTDVAPVEVARQWALQLAAGVDDP